MRKLTWWCTQYHPASWCLDTAALCAHSSAHDPPRRGSPWSAGRGAPSEFAYGWSGTRADAGHWSGTLDSASAHVHNVVILRCIVSCWVQKEGRHDSNDWLMSVGWWAEDKKTHNSRRTPTKIQPISQCIRAVHAILASCRLQVINKHFTNHHNHPWRHPAVDCLQVAKKKAVLRGVWLRHWVRVQIDHMHETHIETVERVAIIVSRQKHRGRALHRRQVHHTTHQALSRPYSGHAETRLKRLEGGGCRILSGVARGVVFDVVVASTNHPGCAWRQGFGHLAVSATHTYYTRDIHTTVG